MFSERNSSPLGRFRRIHDFRLLLREKKARNGKKIAEFPLKKSKMWKNGKNPKIEVLKREIGKKGVGFFLFLTNETFPLKFIYLLFIRAFKNIKLLLNWD